MTLYSRTVKKKVKKKVKAATPPQDVLPAYKSNDTCYLNKVCMNILYFDKHASISEHVQDVWL